MVFLKDFLEPSSICKSYSHFFSKNTCKLDIVLTRTVNILPTNKLVKLTMLQTTGSDFVDCRCSCIAKEMSLSTNNAHVNSDAKIAKKKKKNPKKYSLYLEPCSHVIHVIKIHHAYQRNECVTTG